MDTRFLIFGIVLTMFFAGISSSPVAFAEPKVNCIPAPNAIDIICVWTDNGKFTEVEYCYNDKDGKHVCVSIKASGQQPIPVNELPPKLQDAIDVAAAPSTPDTSEDTKVPKDFLNKGGLLTKDNQITTEDNQITTNKENSPTPPPCPDIGPIPPDCTMKPLLK